ncbi:MAG: L,D-transpeptidase, partial [Chitinophagaceae bacterium]
YGVVNPKRFFRRYQIANERPDSVQMLKVLNSRKLTEALLAVVPANDDYSALQAKFVSEKDETVRDIIALNLERLRWRTPDLGSEHVKVNIPDFSLVWLVGKDTLTTMKVCVGGRREDNFDEKIATWLKTKDLKDLPSNHETPMLMSKLSSIQVNPEWNIPRSIAQSEIYYNAMKDRYYLSNSNIAVYKNGTLITDPDTTRISRIPCDHYFPVGNVWENPDLRISGSIWRW